MMALPEIIPMSFQGEHASKLEAVRRRLSATAQSGNVAVAKALADPRFDQQYLQRFLKARNFDVQKTFEMLKDHFVWRQEMKVDELLARHLRGELCPVISKVKDCYPHGYCGVDKDGHPVYYERIGMLDVKKVLQTLPEEGFMEYFIAESEKTLWERYTACSQYRAHLGHPDASIRVGTGVSVLDVGGVSMSFLNKTSRHVMGLISTVVSNNYPETVRAMYIVNASRVFTWAWPACKPFFPEETRKKIQIVGKGKAVEEMGKMGVPAEYIPEWLGGQCTVCGDKMKTEYMPNVGEAWATGRESHRGFCYDNESNLRPPVFADTLLLDSKPAKNSLTTMSTSVGEDDFTPDSANTMDTLGDRKSTNEFTHGDSSASTESAFVGDIHVIKPDAQAEEKKTDDANTENRAEEPQQASLGHRIIARLTPESLLRLAGIGPTRSASLRHSAMADGNGESESAGGSSSSKKGFEKQGQASDNSSNYLNVAPRSRRNSKRSAYGSHRPLLSPQSRFAPVQDDAVSFYSLDDQADGSMNLGDVDEHNASRHTGVMALANIDENHALANSQSDMLSQEERPSKNCFVGLYNRIARWCCPVNNALTDSPSSRSSPNNRSTPSSTRGRKNKRGPSSSSNLNSPARGASRKDAVADQI